jgi:hypothetical protein
MAHPHPHPAIERVTSTAGDSWGPYLWRAISLLLPLTDVYFHLFPPLR